MTVLSYRLALAWTIAVYLAAYVGAVTFWAYGWYRAVAWIAWPLALLFYVLLRGTRP